ncbi:hypothetical protein D7Y13_35010 [Corallococcus praedator]|uniref:Lipoprotein n=1 Tax=Corallococcus praedator TaxID=2316724 RepID=A0ABX9Q777_9BACT|nr:MULTISPECIES: hypothetical protein [Corallococcus]RKH24796.1 hypothetical protein D7X75_31335 [Corallococcus sp. CA031C]RKH92999.1 hypothetical protein D7Y13_35010 [Corallococcus praedator]
MMRALVAVLAGAVVLSACSEGVSPRPPPAVTPGQGSDSAGPLDPTDVLAGGGSVARPPPEAQGDPVAGEQLPPVEVPPPSGSARVVGAASGPVGLSQVDQVDVDFVVRGVRGRGQVDVEFITPTGRPYEKQGQTVEAPPEESRTLRFSLPVAGTQVTASRMTGTWQARFFLDGVLLATTPFTLEP